MPRNWQDDPTDPLVWGTQVDLGQGGGSAISLTEHRLALLATSGPLAGERWDLDQATVRLGAAPTNDVQIPDTTVSRHHAEIRPRGGRYLLRDLGSTNGTRLEGVPIVEAWLVDGATLGLGNTELRFDSSRRTTTIGESRADRFGSMLGYAPAMRTLFGVLERIAPTTLSVVISGETGTGKELVARGLHDASERARGPFVVVDCGAMSRSLIESDLFGHERGAFTGADRARVGAFERAQGGTLFLDELGEMPLELQPKLLRALEQGEVQRLGGSSTIDVDVRVVAATHRDLGAMVERGEFREDLYYRLAEIVVMIPPLRERRSDVPMLAEAFLSSWRDETGVRSIEEAALSRLTARDYPGNVRELRNVLRRAVALSEGPSIDVAVLAKLDSLAPRPSVSGGAARGASGTVELSDHLGIREARQHWVQTLERDYLEKMRERFGDDVDAMADHMGLLRKSVLRLLRQHGLAE